MRAEPERRDERTGLAWDTAPDDPGEDLADRVESLVLDGMSQAPGPVLTRLDEFVPRLERESDPEPLLLALHGRTIVLARTAATDTDLVAACERLELTAQERRRPVWIAVACATRARIRLDAGEIGAAMGDLGRVDLDQLDQDGGLSRRAGRRLLDILAAIYSRLRIFDRLDDVRERLEQVLREGPALERAWHVATWSGELAARAMEPLAAGKGEPDGRLLDRAVSIARRASDLPEDEVPSALRRALDGVRALAAGYRGNPSQALRLLGQDAFGDAADMPRTPRHLVRLAAMHSHGLVGSLGTARGLDRAADRTGTPRRVVPVADLVLEICQARERLWLETHAGGDTLPVQERLNDLLSRLGWQSMTLVSDTARQALEHQALRAESRTDALTGVGNRRALDEELRHMLRFGRLPVSMVLLDIDRFKQINDRHTHLVGDEVLRRVAAAVTQQMRVGDRLARYGGDEFVLLLPGTGDQEARQVAARMESGIAGMPWSQLTEGLRVGVTTGCAALWSLSGRRPDKDAEYLFRRSDEALLQAKSASAPRVTTGRGQVAAPAGPGTGTVLNGHENVSNGSRSSGPVFAGPDDGRALADPAPVRTGRSGPAAADRNDGLVLQRPDDLARLRDLPALRGDPDRTGNGYGRAADGYGTRTGPLGEGRGSGGVPFPGTRAPEPGRPGVAGSGGSGAFGGPGFPEALVPDPLGFRGDRSPGSSALPANSLPGSPALPEDPGPSGSPALPGDRTAPAPAPERSAPSRRSGRRCASTPLDAPSARQVRGPDRPVPPAKPPFSPQDGHWFGGGRRTAVRADAGRGPDSVASTTNPMIGNMSSNGRDPGRPVPGGLSGDPARESLGGSVFGRRSPSGRPAEPEPLGPRTSSLPVISPPQDPVSGTPSARTIEDLGSIAPNPSLARRRSIRLGRDGWPAEPLPPEPASPGPPQRYAPVRAPGPYDGTDTGWDRPVAEPPGRRPRTRHRPDPTGHHTDDPRSTPFD